MTRDTHTTQSRPLQLLMRLFSISLAGKLVSVGIFMLLARSLDPVHFAFIGLVEPLSVIAIALFCLGIATTLEKKVPSLLVAEPAQARAMMRTGFLVVVASIVLLVFLTVMLVEYWAPILLRGYTFKNETVALFVLPVAVYMLGWIVSVNLLVSGNAEACSRIQIYRGVSGNIAALALYFYFPTEVAVFFGLALGQLPFVAYGIALQRKWLFRLRLYSPLRLIKESRMYHLEGIFNSFKEAGDSVIVSSILGPVGMANYFVARTVAGQLTMFFYPLGLMLVHRFGAKLGESKRSLEREFARVWSIAPPIYIWLAACYAACAPAVVAIFAGESYSGGAGTSAVLTFVFMSGAVFAIASRILLIVGSSFERFRATIVHNIAAVVLLALTSSFADSTTVALSWLGATVIVVIFSGYRAKSIGFSWPAGAPLVRALFVSLPVPLIALAAMEYKGPFDWPYLLIVFCLSGFSLVALILLQEEDEAADIGTMLPKRLNAPYQFVRSFVAGR